MLEILKARQAAKVVLKLSVSQVPLLNEIFKHKAPGFMPRSPSANFGLRVFKEMFPVRTDRGFESRPKSVFTFAALWW